MKMFEYLMLGDVRARKYLKIGARTCSILEKFVFDTTLFQKAISKGNFRLDVSAYCFIIIKALCHGDYLIMIILKFQEFRLS